MVAGMFFQSAAAQPFAAAKNKWLGNVYGNNPPAAEWDQYWNQVTPENAGKWLYCEGNRNEETWGGADAAYAYAKSRNIPFRFHTLVWGQQYPTWIDALPDSQKALEVEDWIRHVGERFPQADFIDVVNEPLTGHAPATYRSALGGTGTTGWDWVIWSFEKARKYLPKTKLFLNEYNILNNYSSTATYLQLVRLLKSRGLIDGIGIQGHRFEIESASLSVLRTNLDSLATAGLPIHITEFDLGNINNSGTANDATQLALYKERFPLLWEHPAVKGITLWGYQQGYIWQSTAYLRLFDGTERPALRWLRKYVVAPPRPTLVGPAASSVGVPRNVRLTWRATETATFYGVQISSDSLFATTDLDVSVSDTTMKSFPLTANKRYFWRVNASNDRDTSEFSSTASFTTGDQTSSVSGPEGMPSSFVLSQNYPNPFNPATTIAFTLPVGGEITLTVVDQLGRIVTTVVKGYRPAGTTLVTLDASGWTSGVYYYSLRTGAGVVQTKKMIVMK